MRQVVSRSRAEISELLSAIIDYSSIGYTPDEAKEACCVMGGGLTLEIGDFGPLESDGDVTHFSTQDIGYVDPFRRFTEARAGAVGALPKPLLIAPLRL